MPAARPTPGPNDVWGGPLNAHLDVVLNAADGTLKSSVVSDANVAASAAIAQSKVATLTTDLAAKIAASIVNAKGDLIVGTADDVVARLAAGADGTYPVTDSAQSSGLKYINRELARVKADAMQGPIAENFPPACHVNVVAPVSGALYLYPLPVLKGVAISKIWIAHSAAPTLTLCKVAIFSLDGLTRHAVSADKSATVIAAAKYGLDLTGSYTPTTDGVLFFGFLEIGTTANMFATGTSVNAGVAATGSGPVHGSRQTGLADMPTTATLAIGATHVWVGWS